MDIREITILTTQEDIIYILTALAGNSLIKNNLINLISIIILAVVSCG